MIVNRDQLSDVAARCFGVASLAQRLFLGLVFVGPILLAIPLHLPAQAVGAGQGGTEPAPEASIDADYDHDSAPPGPGGPSADLDQYRRPSR